MILIGCRKPGIRIVLVLAMFAPTGCVDNKATDLAECELEVTRALAGQGYTSSEFSTRVASCMKTKGHELDTKSPDCAGFGRTPDCYKSIGWF